MGGPRNEGVPLYKISGQAPRVPPPCVAVSALSVTCDGGAGGTTFKPSSIPFADKIVRCRAEAKREPLRRCADGTLHQRHTPQEMIKKFIVKKFRLRISNFLRKNP